MDLQVINHWTLLKQGGMNLRIEKALKIGIELKCMPNFSRPGHWRKKVRPTTLIVWVFGC